MLYCTVSVVWRCTSIMTSYWYQYQVSANVWLKINAPARTRHRMTRKHVRAYFVRAGQRGEKSNGNYFFSSSLYFQDRSDQEESRRPAVKDNLVFIKARNLNRSCCLSISSCWLLFHLLSFIIVRILTNSQTINIACCLFTNNLFWETVGHWSSKRIWVWWPWRGDLWSLL